MKKILLIIYYLFLRKIHPFTSEDNCLSNKMRYYVARRVLKHCGKGTIVRYNCYFGSGDRLYAGDRCSLGYNARLLGNITLGDDCMMGPDVVMMSMSHAFNRIDIPIKQQGAQEDKPIVIGNDCWIGTRAIIMPGVHLGDHCIVGSGAVVTKSFPEYAIIAGVPAKIIRYREH